MDLQAKKQQLLANLEQIRGRISQLSQELASRQTQEQQVVGAILLCDELLAERAASAEKPETAD